MWCGEVWCGVVWCGVVWCGVVWCGVVWCGVVWCGVVCIVRMYLRINSRYLNIPFQYIHTYVRTFLDRRKNWFILTYILYLTVSSGIRFVLYVRTYIRM